MSLYTEPSSEFSLESTMPYRKIDGTKEKLVGATIDCLAELGLEQTSFEAIGKRVGIGRANVRYHYKDKEDLFIAAVRYVTDTQQKITLSLISSAGDPTARLQAVVDGIYLWLEQYPNQKKVWALFWYFAATKPHYHALHAQLRNQSTTRIGHIVAELSQRSLGAEEKGLIAKNIQSLLTGELLENATGQKQTSYASAKERTWESVTSILRGRMVIGSPRN